MQLRIAMHALMLSLEASARVAMTQGSATSASWQGIALKTDERLAGVREMLAACGAATPEIARPVDSIRATFDALLQAREAFDGASDKRGAAMPLLRAINTAMATTSSWGSSY